MIILGDSFEAVADMQNASVDLILTDPPYSISKAGAVFSNKGDSRYHRCTLDYAAWDHQEVDMERAAKLMFGVLRDGGTAIVFYDLWKISPLASALRSAGFGQLRFIEWIKSNPVPINSSINYLSNGREIAVAAVKGSNPTFHSKYDIGEYRYHTIKGKIYHPTQKPLPLMEALVSKHSNPEDLVLDPFAGSGTTGIAAHRLGRRWIGVEINEEHYNAACARLEAETAQGRLVA